MKNLLLSLHIPKTAGSSFKSSLKTNFREDTLFMIQGPDYYASRLFLENLPEEEKQKINCIHGHFAFGLHRSFEERSCQYLTFLRHPVDRLISLYSFIKNNPKHKRHEILVSKNWGLIDFLNSQIHPEIENCQTKMLSGRAETDFLSGSERCSDFDFERAIGHVEKHFPVVGLTEFYGDSLELINYFYSLELRSTGRKNVTKSRPALEELDAKAIDAITRQNKYDLELYQYCYERYWKQVRAKRVQLIVFPLIKKVKRKLASYAHYW